MSKVCEGCGKKPSTGHSVSHSNRKTKRRFLPNLFRKRLMMSNLKDTRWIKICTRCLRTLTNKYAEKYGMTDQALAALQKKCLHKN